MFCEYFIVFITAVLLIAQPPEFRCTVPENETVRFTLGTGRYTKLYNTEITDCINETVTCEDEPTSYSATFNISVNGEHISYISPQSQILNAAYNESLEVEQLLFRDDRCYYLQVTGPAIVYHHVQTTN